MRLSKSQKSLRYIACGPITNNNDKLVNRSNAMTVKDQLKSEIDRLDERYLDLVYKIICQFPHDPGKV